MDNHGNKTAHYIRYALIALALLFSILLVFLVVQYQTLRFEAALTGHEFHVSQMLERHAPLPTSDADIIREWMTFDYINKLFALPPDYMKSQLHIVDPRYPRVTISSYAKNAALDPAAVRDGVEGVVRRYMVPVPLETTTSTKGSGTTSVPASASSV